MFAIVLANSNSKFCIENPLDHLLTIYNNDFKFTLSCCSFIMVPVRSAKHDPVNENVTASINTIMTAYIFCVSLCFFCILQPCLKYLLLKSKINTCHCLNNYFI